MNSKEILFYKKNGYLKYPKILQIEITNKCPLNCPQCYKDIDNIKDMNYKVFREIIISESKKGLKSVMINGGEPLIHKDFEKIMFLLSKNNIAGNCFTSGYNLNKSLAKKVNKAGLFLNVSLNGSTEKINKLSRDGYKHAFKAIEILSKNNVRYGISWVARHDNVNDFTNIIKIAENYNASNILIIGNKLNHMREVESKLNKNDLNKLVSFINNYEKKQNGLNILRQQCFTELCFKFNPSSVDRLNNGCPAGIISCYIDIERNYMPCSHLHYKEKYDSVSDYWENSKTLKKLRNINTSEIEDCKDCKNNKYCNFCRAVSLKTHNNFYLGLDKCLIRI